MTKPGKMHCYMDLNNRRTGKDATKPRILGLFWQWIMRKKHFQKSMHCDLDLWTENQQGTSSTHGESVCEDSWLNWRCKVKVIMRQKPFSVTSALWPWPFDPKIKRAHPQLKGSLYVKFHSDGCKGKTIMWHKTIFSNQCIVTVIFCPQNQ